MGATPECVRLTGGLPDDPCWCGACGEDEQEVEARERELEAEDERSRDELIARTRAENARLDRLSRGGF